MPCRLTYHLTPTRDTHTCHRDKGLNVEPRWVWHGSSLEAIGAYRMNERTMPQTDAAPRLTAVYLNTWTQLFDITRFFPHTHTAKILSHGFVVTPSAINGRVLGHGIYLAPLEHAVFSAGYAVKGGWFAFERGGDDGHRPSIHPSTPQPHITPPHQPQVLSAAATCCSASCGSPSMSSWAWYVRPWVVGPAASRLGSTS